jgi:uncharacterized phage protein gp47/JayE
MSFGITATGFVRKTYQDCLAELTAEVLQEVDPNLNTAPTEPIGQILGIFARKEAEMWELLEIAFNSLDPDAAEDFLQENLCALTGVRRNPATYSLCKDVAVTLTDGATLPAGSLAHVEDKPTYVFASVSDVTANVGAGVYSVDFRATTAGPVPANTGKLNVIAGPVTGWSAVSNPTDAILGDPEEDDTQLRIRREASLQATGGSGVDHIRSDLYALADEKDVTDFSAYVYENTADFTDSFGRPPHSIECVIYDGLVPGLEDDDIAQRIWDSKASGVGTYGSVDGTATDAAAGTHVVRFNRADLVEIYVDLTLETAPGVSVASVSQAVKTAIVTYAAEHYGLGDDVIALAVRAAALVPGVVDVPTFFIDITASPAATANIPMTIREKAVFDTSRITVA